MRASLIVLLATGLAAAGEPPPEVAKELKRLEGTWRMSLGEENGEKAAKDETKSLTITFDGEKFIAKVGVIRIMSGVVEVEPGKKGPQPINLLVRAGRMQGETIEAIYEIDGDTLTLCLPAGKERPKEFS
jgi:uncharacterized protein (TIGR03067 family)